MSLHRWVSVGSDLKFDARRDLDDVQATCIEGRYCMFTYSFCSSTLFIVVFSFISSFFPYKAEYLYRNLICIDMVTQGTCVLFVSCWRMC